jgi:cell division transport system ATP-binding protein
VDPLIIYKGVTIMQEDRPVIAGLDLTVRKGEFVYLLGKTGSGKSSLLRTLYADIPVKNGEAGVCGFDLLHIRRNEIPFLRRKIGIVFQDFQLLGDRNVYNNLRFVMRATGWTDEKKIKEGISQVMSRVGIAGLEEKMPNELSGGEQQRVVIARALVNNPDMILADEPTGNLDSEASEDILKLLRQICEEGKAILFATHDLLLYNKFRARTLVFENGAVKEKP